MTITIPEKLAEAFRTDGADVERQVLERLVVAAFHEGRIGSHQAASMLGLAGRNGFHKWLGEQGIPYFTSVEEYERDHAQVEASLEEMRRAGRL